MNSDQISDREFEELLEATKHAWPRAVRHMWDERREEMRRFLLEEKKFNRKAIPNFIDNFINSMVHVAESEAEYGVSEMRKNRKRR